MRTVSKRFEGVYLNKLKNGDISYSFTYYAANGKKQRFTVGKKSQGITEVFVNHKRSETINMIRLGEDPTAKKKKAKSLQFSEVWTNYVENKAMSDAVRNDYKGRWNKHMSKHFSSQVTMNGLTAFREQLSPTLSPRSIDMMIGMIGSAIRYWNSMPKQSQKIDNPVAELRAYDRDHVTKTEKKSRKVSRDRYLSKEEIETLKANVDGELLLFVEVALSTGARLGSIMSIQAKHIKGSNINIINHKSGGDTYTAYINADTAAKVKALGLAAGDNLFSSTKASIQKRLQRVLNTLFNKGLDTSDRVNRAVVHTLRHTFASHLVAAGTPLPVVKELMGHSDINMTMRYSHLAPDAGKQNVLDLYK